jgi:hypothetical protein
VHLARDTHPGVGDLEDDVVAIAIRRDVHLAARHVVLRCVVEEVAQHLRDARAILFAQAHVEMGVLSSQRNES